MSAITIDPTPRANAASGLQMRGITKVFPGTLALDAVDLTVAAGEVHGLVGENGAGKSTLIKILSGLYRTDSGRITLNGEALTITRPADAEAAGIYVIHQDRQLVGRLSVAESLFLGRDERGGALLYSKRTLNARAKKALKQLLDIEINPELMISELSVAHQQLVQIARAMMVNPKLVIFDEPTAPLAQREVQKLFEIIEGLKSRGVSVIYISHYLQEVRDICERVTVLRNGRKVGELSLATSTLEDVVHLMIGRDVQEFAERAQRRPNGEPVLSISGLESGSLTGVSFSVRPGEVVGITGLIGSGADELAAVLVGLQKIRGGSYELKGKTLRSINPVAVSKRGVAYVPADRRKEGAAMSMNIRENLALASPRKFDLLGFIMPKAEKVATQATAERLNVKPANIATPVRDLSGGNQQKVVFGKWLVAESDVFILDQPTSGVDIGSRAEIYRIIDDLTESGSATVVVSQDLEELVGMSDRILVLYRGQIAHEFDRASATVDRVLAVSTGAAV